MDKRTFFLKAMAAQEYRRRAWVISAFSLINEGGDAWKKEPYAYRLVQMPTGHFFVDPDKNGELTKIDDTKAGSAPFSFKDRILLKKGDMPNVFQEVDTNYGNVLLNYTVLVYPFGHKVPFVTGRIKPRQLENIVLARLEDTPKAGETRDDKYLYVDEYINFVDAAFAMVAYTQLCVPAATEKTMQPADGIHEYRDKLLAENKDRLHDPAVIAKIDAALVQYDREWLKGDPGENFMITDKSMAIVRKRQHGMWGAEAGLSENINVDLIPTSLGEGWDIDKFPQMNNSHRAGSYNRGAQTMLGGESVKWLLRASSNINITVDDCGTKMGLPLQVDNDNIEMLVGFSIVSKQGRIRIPDMDTARQYLGKRVIVRSPMYCKLTLTDYCKCCVGDRLAANPTSASTAVAGYGSAFLNIYMQAGHGKKLSLAKFDWKKDIF
jgi:hypothetical protein